MNPWNQNAKHQNLSCKAASTGFQSHLDQSSLLLFPASGTTSNSMRPNHGFRQHFQSDPLCIKCVYRLYIEPLVPYGLMPKVPCGVGGLHANFALIRLDVDVHIFTDDIFVCMRMGSFFIIIIIVS